MRGERLSLRQLLASGCVISAVLAGWSGATAQGQQRSTVSKLVFQNAGPYSQKDLEQAAGVHAGQKLSLADMQAAAQRLVDTGSFDNASLESKGQPDALTLIFVLKPSAAGDLHPISFGNFVWFTPEELMTIARKTAPLVGSGLPEGGVVLDNLSEALQAALVAKGIPGAQVSHTLILPSTASPVSAIQYRVEQPRVILRTIQLEGVAPEFQPAMQTVAARLQGSPYVDGPTAATERALLQPYLDAGYLDVSLRHVALKPVAEQGGVYGVELQGEVDRGEAYRVGAIQFEGSALMSQDAFTAGEKLHAGDVASRARLLASVEPLDAMYHKLGYMDEYVDLGARPDPAAHTVSYRLKVVPGPVYHVRKVAVEGLSPATRAEFDRAWTLKTGDPYDAEYVRTFVTKNSALPSLRGLQARLGPQPIRQRTRWTSR